MDQTDLLCRTRPLRALLAERPRSRDCSRFASASEEAIALAQALGPDLAAFAVRTMLDGYERGRDPATHERAADLAFRLRLAGAAPALVGCLERLSEYDSVAHAALRALEAMREAATPLLLASFSRATSAYERELRACALNRVGARGARVRDAYLAVLAENPRSGAGYLAEHHDRSALPQLLATFDRLEPGPEDAGELERLETIVAVGGAIRTLRGSFTKAQRKKFEHAWARSGELLLGDACLSEPEAGTAG